MEKVSVLTKWRQSSDPSKDSSSGSEKSSYALRKVHPRPVYLLALGGIKIRVS